MLFFYFLGLAYFCNFGLNQFDKSVSFDRKHSHPLMRKITYLFIVLVLLSNSFRAQYSWSNVGAGTNLYVHALATDTVNHVVYAGGVFTQAGGNSALGIAKWDGANWTPLGSGVVMGTGVSALLMDGSDLFVAGSFTNVGGVAAKNIARWNGSTWSALGTGLEYTGATTVSTMLMHNNELYAGGIFSTAGATTVNNIAKWDGVNWQPLGTGTNGAVKSLCVYNGEVYAGGSFTDAGGVLVKNIAKWNGTNWADVGGGLDYTGATTVSTMRIFNNALYAGGTFTTAGTTPVKHLAMWDGVNWSDVGNGASDYTGATTVSTMKVFNNQLIVGGSFDTLGTTPASNIGAWDGVNWSAMGSGMNNHVAALESLQDTLYAGGYFSNAGGTTSYFVAQWKPSPLEITSSESLYAVQNLFIVYPNPASTKISIKMKNDDHSGLDPLASIIITDQLGREVIRIVPEANSVDLKREKITAGMYFYKICLSDNKVIQTGTLIVE
jgi:hypothetical protein